jgi:hypothetical protein
MLLMRFTVKEMVKFIIQGKRTMRQTEMTRIFGTKTSVISCNCVAA